MPGHPSAVATTISCLRRRKEVALPVRNSPEDTAGKTGFVLDDEMHDVMREELVIPRPCLGPSSGPFAPVTSIM
jgi:hypothetical protein